MKLVERIKALFHDDQPEHLRRGELGERTVKDHLRRHGLKFLTANLSSRHGEIDLIFRDADCLTFVEVKMRSYEDWTRPAGSRPAASGATVCRSPLSNWIFAVASERVLTIPRP